MTISISGNDGSGKTTSIKQLNTVLKKSSNYNIEVRQEFDYFLLKYLLKLLGPDTNKTRKQYLTKEKTMVQKIVGVVWTYLVCIDLFAEALYLKVAKRSSIVILDRCIYDFLVSWKYLNIYSFPLSYIVKLFPKYDLSIILIVDPKTAFERKKDTHTYPISFYKNQTQRYHNLKTVNDNLVFVNTKNTLQHTTKIILDQVINVILKKSYLTEKNMSLVNEWLNTIKSVKITKKIKKDVTELKLTKDERNMFPKGTKLSVIKRFALKTEKNNEIDIFAKMNKNELKKHFNSSGISYEEEPDRISTKTKKRELDIHTRLSFWNIDFFNHKNISISNNRIDPFYESLFYTAHSIYKHGVIQKEDQLAYLLLFFSSDFSVKDQYEYARKHGWEEGYAKFISEVVRALQHGNYDDKTLTQYEYLSFWVKLSKKKSVPVKSICVAQYAHFRDTHLHLQKIMVKATKTTLAKNLIKKLGYKYE